MQALGMIEVHGYLAAVEALDSALKAANVHRLGVTLVTGGLVSVLVTGDVGAVKAAIDAAAAAVGQFCEVVSVHVIPHPDESVYRVIDISVPICNDPAAPKSCCIVEEQKNETKKDEFVIDEQNNAEDEHEDISVTEETGWQGSVHAGELAQTSETAPAEQEDVNTDAGFEEMSLTRLRKLAVDIGIKGMTSKEIRRAKRDVLIAAIKEQGRQGE